MGATSWICAHIEQQIDDNWSDVDAPTTEIDIGGKHIATVHCNPQLGGDLTIVTPCGEPCYNDDYDPFFHKSSAAKFIAEHLI